MDRAEAPFAQVCNEHLTCVHDLAEVYPTRHGAERGPDIGAGAGAAQFYSTPDRLP